MSERKKHERPPFEQLIPPPESPEETEVPSVEPPAAAVEGVPAVESETDSEPATGNEQRTEGQQDPAPEATDAANQIEDDESAGDTNSA